jgi:antitoxin HigA-1
MQDEVIMPPVHPGEVLLTEFLQPLELSQYQLARSIAVPPRRINEIVHGQRRISADTALRLARFFGTSERFWMNLQSRYDLEIEKDRLGPVLDEIHPLTAASLRTLTISGPGRAAGYLSERDGAAIAGKRQPTITLWHASLLMNAAAPVIVGSGLLSCRDRVCMGLRQFLRNRFPSEPLPEDPVARLQYVYDKVLGYVDQDCTVHEVKLLLYPWLRAAFPAGPDSLPRSSADQQSDAEHLARRERVVL